MNLKALTNSLTKKESLDEKVEKALMQVTEDVLDDVLDLACRLAKHRGSLALHRNDIKIAFEKRLKVRIAAGPGYEGIATATSGQQAPLNIPPSLTQLQTIQPESTANYKTNLALVKKAQEHYSHR